MTQTNLTIPSGSILNEVKLNKDYLKIYHLKIPRGTPLQKVVGTFFTASPEWLQEINSTSREIKEKIGFKTESESINIVPGNLREGDRIGNYQVKHLAEKEIMLASDGKQTKSRLSFFLLPLKEGHQHQTLAISHLVQFNGLMGRLYWQGVKYYQQELMKETIDNMANQLTGK